MQISRTAVIGMDLLAVLILLAVPTASSVVLTGSKDTPVDLALPMPQLTRPILGTKKVEPDKDEKPYFEKMPADQLVTGSFSKGYDLSLKTGKFIGWYGIVRAIKEDPAAKQTTLTVQHTYSDASTDLHIMTVSSYGAGDFVAKVQGIHLPLLPLRLVKIHGTVESNTSGKPVVVADFVKEWDWGNFNFMGYGPDKRNSEWKALSKVSDKQIYDPYPRMQYYRDRLGNAPAHIYDVMTPDQVLRYAKEIPAGQSDMPKMAAPLTAPLFVGEEVRVKAEMGGNRMPFAIAFKQPSEYVEFVKANMVHRQPVIDRQHLAHIETETEAKVIRYALPEESAMALYLVSPLSGKYKDQEWWIPGFLLESKKNPTTTK